ncbi:hypothetical protein SGGMMB4_02778 [Sodalis glossinidius str. 'morsitans']|uniref:Uncharacterized protein n=1 Tax=Sodalis glossinidius (strain morsitans) TaxID=343509 RepID=A0A193QJ60_SODGM|nr:hypothetical protein SGGMMB4_02098 [Sodalis glossinidius str. 'morsitans']CRL45212.1 hypothetical protein SGGMMB4_02778 [Sodalis glossinidius str. 'morsitans']
MAVQPRSLSPEVKRRRVGHKRLHVGPEPLKVFSCQLTHESFDTLAPLVVKLYSVGESVGYRVVVDCQCYLIVLRGKLVRFWLGVWFFPAGSGERPPVGGKGVLGSITGSKE